MIKVKYKKLVCKKTTPLIQSVFNNPCNFLLREIIKLKTTL